MARFSRQKLHPTQNLPCHSPWLARKAPRPIGVCVGGDSSVTQAEGVGLEESSPCFDVGQMSRIAPNLDRVAQRGHPRPPRHRRRIRVGTVAEIDILALAIPSDGRRRALVVRPSAELRILNRRRVVRQKDRAVDIARVGPEVVHLFVSLVPIRQGVDSRMVDQLGKGLFRRWQRRARLVSTLFAESRSVSMKCTHHVLDGRVVVEPATCESSKIS